MPNNVRMSSEAARATLGGMNVNAGPKEVAGFLAGQPSDDLLSQAMGKLTNIESRILLAQAGAPLLPALNKILTGSSCDFAGMRRLIEAASAVPTEDELRKCMGWAIRKGNLSAVQFLIGKGAPVAGESNFKSVEHERFLYPSLFTCAILSENREIVALFLQLDPAVINQTYGESANGHHDSALLAKKNMMELNNPEASFAVLSEESKTAFLCALQSRQAELIKSTSGSNTHPFLAIIFSVLAAWIPGLISLEMCMSSDGDYAMKTAGLVFLGVAALCVLVGVVGAVSIAMHNRKCEQLNNQKKEVENRIAELNGQEQGASQPSAPPPYCQ